MSDSGLELHLEGCPACRSLARALEDQRASMRLHAPRAIPDLSGAILARSSPRRAAPLAVLQWALASLGAVLVVIATFAVAPGDLPHAHRELSAWYGAFGASLLVVAWQPDRARGLFPFAALVGVGLATTAVLDVATGRSPALHEVSHLLELAGVVLVGATARVASPLPSHRRVLA